jgi:hypothetical protein
MDGPLPPDRMREFDRLMSADASLLEVVEAVRGLDYGRPSDRSVEGMLREHRGTCSLKHLFLADARPFIEALAQVANANR